MHRGRMLLIFVLTVVMCVFLFVNSHAEEAEEKARPVLPSEYPISWGVVFQKGAPLASPYLFGRQTTVLPKGTTYPPPNAMALPCNIIWDRDVPVTLRDGTVIYTNIFRPEGSPNNLPAIISWSPYGKTIPAGGSLASPSIPAEWISGIAPV